MKVLVILLVLVALTIGDVMPSSFQENSHPIEVNADPPQEGQGRRHNSCLAQFIQCVYSEHRAAGRSYNYIAIIIIVV